MNDTMNPLAKLRQGAAAGKPTGCATAGFAHPAGARWIIYILLIIGALLLPYSGFASLMSPDADWPTELFFPIGVYVLLAIGLNVVVGYAGMLDLGYVAFWAIGAYTMAEMGTRYHWNFWEILPLGIAMAAVSGVILGAPTLRLRGDYLAIVTLGFGEIIYIVASNTHYLGESQGVPSIPAPPSVKNGPVIGGAEVLKYTIVDARPFYYLLVGIIVLAIIFVKRLEKSRIGRAWAAIREDEDAAEVMGVPTYKFKLLAFAIGAAIGGSRRGDVRVQGRVHQSGRLPVPGVRDDPGRGGARRFGQPAWGDLRRVHRRVAPRPVPGAQQLPGSGFRWRAGVDDGAPAGGPDPVEEAEGRDGRGNRWYGQHGCRDLRSGDERG